MKDHQLNKNIDKKTCLHLEKKLHDIAEKTHLILGNFDLNLWIMNSGKVLK